MFICTKLSRKNLLDLETMNYYRKSFNPLNVDFFKTYDEANFAQQILLRKRVNLVLHNGSYVGYIWCTGTDRDSSIINSMYSSQHASSEEIFKFMIDTLGEKSNLTYLCEKRGKNFETLEHLGFEKCLGTIELTLYLGGPLLDIKSDFQFETVIRGKDELLRCEIQNEIFDHSDRVPLDIEDIFFDQTQDYYFEEGSVFMKKGDSYIGYGQIIIENNVPSIVNFGIRKQYQGKGYGKIFLTHLLRIIKEYQFKYVNLKVKSDNHAAYQLYRRMGFEVTREYYKWQLKR